jgi:polyketide cyclase/dehydrase/lipid transport protein
MAKKLLIAFLILLALVLMASVVVALQPGTFSVERSATMEAPPAAVFLRVNDLKEWDSWSPWKDLDPDPRMTFSSPSVGKGAAFSWSGNDQVGEGNLTILESTPDRLVELEQAFVRPLSGKARMTFTLAPAGSGTRVVWKMEGTNDFAGKAICMVMSMDSVVGGKMAQGLANMKSVVEKRDGGR